MSHLTVYIHQPVPYTQSLAPSLQNQTNCISIFTYNYQLQPYSTNAAHLRRFIRLCFHFLVKHSPYVTRRMSTTIISLFHMSTLACHKEWWLSHFSRVIRVITCDASVTVTCVRFRDQVTKGMLTLPLLTGTSRHLSLNFLYGGELLYLKTPHKVSHYSVLK